MSTSFNFEIFGCCDNVNERNPLKMKNGAHEFLQFLTIFAGISLSIPALLGFKKRISLITSFNSIYSKKCIVKIIYFFFY